MLRKIICTLIGHRKGVERSELYRYHARIPENYGYIVHIPYCSRCRTDIGEEREETIDKQRYDAIVIQARRNSL
jgi:hypothetical protein